MAGSTDRMNVLYIMSDEQRYDSLSHVGRSICRTPNLDGLAAEGIRFDNAYSVCALCSPARASMLNGLYPHNHHMWNNNDMMQWAVRDMPDSVRLISQVMGAAGYHCGFSGKWHCGETKLPRSYGFEGMQVPNYGDPYRTAEYAAYLAARGLEPPRRVDIIRDWAGGTLSGPPEACEPYYVTEVALDLLRHYCREREAKGRPFLVFVSLWGPHHACFVPEPYASMYNPDDVALWPNMRDSLDNKPNIQRRYLRTFYPEAPHLDDDTWRRIIGKYWGFCTFVDDQVGRLLGALSELGQERNTAVLFSTDHGDMTGAHGGFWDKDAFMYEETYHIPLLARVPGLTKAGSVCHRLVSNMDLATTALDVAGLLAPVDASGAGAYDGRSLVPLFREPDGAWRDDLMCEFHGHRYLYSQRMVRWGDVKYIYNASEEDEVYDLRHDPHELTNVLNEPSYRPVVQEGRQRLLKWIDDSRDPIKFAARHQLTNW